MLAHQVKARQAMQAGVRW